MKKLFTLLMLGLFFTACEKEQIIYIADHFADAQNQYLYARSNETDEWTVFKDPIEGFTYEEGYAYKLKVLVKKNKNEQPTIQLLEVLSKNKNINKALIDVKWEVQKLKGVENLESGAPFFSIKDHKISGSTSCNTFSADFQLNNNRVSIGEIMTTKKFCVDLAKIENAFLSNLRNSEIVTLENNQIIFKDKAGEVLFSATESPQKSINAIENTWYLTSLKGAALHTEKPIYFTIKANQIRGNDACNTFGGNFLTDANNLFKTSKIKKTMMFCEDTDQLERKFHDNLSKVASYKIENNSLLLMDASGYVLMTAGTKENALKKEVPSNYIVEYKVFAPDLAYSHKIIEKEATLYRKCLLPEVCSKKEIYLSKTDLRLFDEAIQKLNLPRLENLKVPSSKYKENQVPGATLIITYQGKTYRVPTFDHGNPPQEISGIVKKIDELISSQHQN